jgi:poly-beta-1,6-N-acetyl-D-glucosamine biosynthesis protein PgaD
MSDPVQSPPASTPPVVATPQPMPLAWPPLVGSDRVPRAVRLRDLLLTILAWCAFAWMLRNAILLSVDWFREPFGQFTYMQAPDWPRLWERLRNYVNVAALLVVWIAFWAVYRSKDLKPSGLTEAPPQALADSVLCARYRVAPEQLQSWQAQQVVTVDVAADGRISDATPGKLRTPG